MPDGNVCCYTMVKKYVKGIDVPSNTKQHTQVGVTCECSSFTNTLVKEGANESLTRKVDNDTIHVHSESIFVPPNTFVCLDRPSMLYFCLLLHRY